jgi:mRNA-degrading endonuclease toxin of MazEF toxin-antitoxin module
MRVLEAALRGADLWYPHRQDVCWAQLDKKRPAIILSIDELNQYSHDVCLIPTTCEHHGEFTLRVDLAKGDGGLPDNCWAKCDQPTTIERRDVQGPSLGRLSDEKFREIQINVRKALGLTKIV